jgi:Hypothetical protein (DUF2513)
MCSTSPKYTCVNVPGYQLLVVAYHMKIMAERGLIDGKPLSSAGTAHDFIAHSLTWEGQEFLDTIKNDTAWKKVKSYARDRGADLTFDTIKTLATMYVKNLLRIGAG